MQGYTSRYYVFSAKHFIAVSMMESLSCTLKSGVSSNAQDRTSPGAALLATTVSPANQRLPSPGRMLQSTLLMLQPPCLTALRAEPYSPATRNSCHIVTNTTCYHVEGMVTHFTSTCSPERNLPTRTTGAIMAIGSCYGGSGCSSSTHRLIQ